MVQEIVAPTSVMADVATEDMTGGVVSAAGAVVVKLLFEVARLPEASVLLTL